MWKRIPTIEVFTSSNGYGRNSRGVATFRSECVGEVDSLELDRLDTEAAFARRLSNTVNETMLVVYAVWR